MNQSRVKQTLVRTTLLAALTAGLAMSLQGCVLGVLGAAAGGGALIATDRRTLGAQTEDREIQVKSLTQINNGLPDQSHVNVTVFNRRVLLTGEVPKYARRADRGSRDPGQVAHADQQRAAGPVARERHGVQPSRAADGRSAE